MASGFDGTWQIDIANSRVWDASAGKYVQDEVGQEIITMTTVDGVQDYEVLLGLDPTVRMGYTSRFDDTTWVPYLVREILGLEAGEDEAAAIARFKASIKADQGPGARRMEVGRTYGLVRLFYVDERTHYRISKDEDGTPQVAMLRRLSEDGNSYLSSVLDINGVVFRIRPFIRVS